MFIPYEQTAIRGIMSILLISIYVLYLVLTLKTSKQLVESGHGVETDEPLILHKCGLKNNLTTILIQLVIGVVLLLIGAKGFIYGVVEASNLLNISVLV